MKKILVLLILVLSTNAIAQKKITEGVIKTKMTMSSENPQVNQQLSMMGDLMMTTYFKGNNSRSEMKNPMAGNNTTILNGDAKKLLALLDNPYLGKKYKEQSIDISKQDLDSIQVIANGKVKTILGYECKGYDVVVKLEGVENKMTLFTTDKITAINQNNAMLGEKSTGFPMYVVTSINQGGMVMQMTLEVTKVESEKVDDLLFKLDIPKGYTKMEAPKPSGID
jgi:hypothetical protein